MALLFLSDNDPLHEQNLLLLRASMKEGQKNLYVCPDNSINANVANSQNIPFIEIPNNKIGKYFQLRSIIKKNRIHVIHVFDEPSLKIALLLQKTFCPIQIIMSHHERVNFEAQPTFQAQTDYALRAFMQNKLLLLFVSSSELYHHLQTKSENSTRLRYLPYSIDLETNENRRGDDSQIIPHNSNDRFIFLVNAPLIPESGIDILLKAFSLLPQELVTSPHNPIVELHILGVGEEFDNLLELAHEYNVQDTIAFLGAQDSVAFIQTSNAIICPAISGDGDYIMILHAWKYNSPLIVSDLSVHTKMALTGAGRQAALVYPRTEPEILAKCMSTILNDESCCNNITSMGSKIIHNFNLEMLEKEYIRFTNKYI